MGSRILPLVTKVLLHFHKGMFRCGHAARKVLWTASTSLLPSGGDKRTGRRQCQPERQKRGREDNAGGKRWLGWTASRALNLVYVGPRAGRALARTFEERNREAKLVAAVHVVLERLGAALVLLGGAGRAGPGCWPRGPRPGLGSRHDGCRQAR